jgi:hypothetical protein
VREKGELLHPDCKDKKVLDEAKETLGSHGFQAQYQQDPVPQATAGFGQKQSLTETTRKVRFPIRKQSFERIAAAQNDLFVGYVGLGLSAHTLSVGRSAVDTASTAAKLSDCSIRMR